MELLFTLKVYLYRFVIEHSFLMANLTAVSISTCVVFLVLLILAKRNGDIEKALTLSTAIRIHILLAVLFVVLIVWANIAHDDMWQYLQP